MMCGQLNKFVALLFLLLIATVTKSHKHHDHDVKGIINDKYICFLLSNERSTCFVGYILKTELSSVNVMMLHGVDF